MQNNTFFGDLLPRHIIVLNKTTSTNDYLKQLLANFTPLPEYSAIMARIQTQGRGQRNTTWISEPHQNLTASFYIKPQNLSVVKQFFLTIIGSLAVRDTLHHYTQLPVSIKWPNDIYIENRKIGGLLFENRVSAGRIAHAVLGIGLNVLQTTFPADLQSKAISLAQVTQQDTFSFIEITGHVQRYLAHYNQLLIEGHSDRLIAQYNDHLFQKGELKSYQMDDQVFEGIIIGVEEDGLLQIKQGNKVKKHDLKHIIYRL